MGKFDNKMYVFTCVLIFFVNLSAERYHVKTTYGIQNNNEPNKYHEENCCFIDGNYLRVGDIPDERV